MNYTHLSQKHVNKSRAKLLFGKKYLSRTQHVNMGAAYNHTEFLNWDRERGQMGKNICVQSES